MPRYTKDGGDYGYRKRYKKQNHGSIAQVLSNLSRREFRIMQEIAKHGMGLYTPYRELLSAHPKTKVRPSSFEQYASAKNQEELAESILREKSEHDDHTSETHMGGGLADAHNAVGSWAYDLALDAGSHVVANWAIDQLDPETSEDHRELAAQGLQAAVDMGVDYFAGGDNEEEKVIYADEVNPGEIPNESWIDHILATGNQVVDTAGWIGGILGTTADFLSQMDSQEPFPYQ